MSSPHGDPHKHLAGHIIAVLMVILLGIISIMAIGGDVNLQNPAVSLFLGSLVGVISGLLAAPFVYYYGVPPGHPENGNGNGTKRYPDPPSPGN